MLYYIEIFYFFKIGKHYILDDYIDFINNELDILIGKYNGEWTASAEDSINILPCNKKYRYFNCYMFHNITQFKNFLLELSESDLKRDFNIEFISCAENVDSEDYELYHMHYNNNKNLLYDKQMIHNVIELCYP